MLPLPSGSAPQGVRVWLAAGVTDMRKGFPGLSLIVQETLEEGSARRPSVRLPRAARRPDQGHLA